jgi:catechol 2,3-dioxygenase-like lactoylglutathione lyase family enzyme
MHNVLRSAVPLMRPERRFAVPECPARSGRVGSPARAELLASLPASARRANGLGAAFLSALVPALTLGLGFALPSAPARAQLAAPNTAGVSMGHIHLVVPDADAQTRAWEDVFGAEPVSNGRLTALRLPGVFLLVTPARTPPTGGTIGSAVHHIGFLVKSYADIAAKARQANLPVRELTPNQQAFITFPDDVTVEIAQDETLSTPVAFHHVHMSVTDPEAARAWYAKELGAESSTRRNLPAAKIPGGEVDFLKAADAPAPTKGRALDHIGFDVRDLKATLERLEADGVTINVPYIDATERVGLKVAFITDPYGAYIELTEGLAAFGAASPQAAAPSSGTLTNAAATDDSANTANAAGASPTAAAAAAAWTPPKTPWGEPDLRGTWPISHLIDTPLVRPKKYGNRRFMTDEEFAAQQAKVEKDNSRYSSEQTGDRIGGGHWIDPTEPQRLTSLIVDPPDGSFPALTERGKELAKQFHSSYTGTVFDSIADFDSWDRCISRGMPVAMLPRHYNNGIRIIQSPGYVVINVEMIDTRVIPIDAAPLDSAIKQWTGAPIGHWEGNTLVVESTNFTGKTGTTNYGVPGSPTGNTPSTVNMHTTERFTRVDDDTIQYELTVEDPEVLTRPFTIAYPMKRDDSYRLFEYACHEGNTAVRNYIETSRYERAHAAQR